MAVKKKGKNLSNPFSTGGGGGHFEAHVQASFVVLMLTGGFAPCLPSWPISKIKLQGKFAGYETDDLIIFVKHPGNNQERKILCQVKHSIGITETNKVFGEVIQAAWNDYNNSSLFNKGRDSIVLITGPLSATDINDVRTILEWARSFENADEFIQNVQLTNFSSQSKQNKLQAFRTNLDNANGGNSVSDELLFDFLKHFHLLGYDLDIRAGVTISLLHSLIGQYSQQDVQSLWLQIVDEVQSANKNAGTISRDGLPEALQTIFMQKVYEVIPSEFSVSPFQLDKTANPIFIDTSELVIANIVGAWNEANPADLEIITKLKNEEYNSWISKVRDILCNPDSPLSLKNGRWHVKDRRNLWLQLAPRVFDNTLDDLKNCILTVLSEYDPQFELPPEERYAASYHGKKLKHSGDIRKGLAESLALLGCLPDDLTNCSRQKSVAVAVLTVRELLENADWVLWGSLNPILPELAEAAPDEFLCAVESALQQNTCPFDELFVQEDNGISGRNYLTGLLWALENLAWDQQYLVRVSVVLGELDSHDPGGKWANRPINSLTTILLPWLPQTTASIDKRKVAVQTLCREVPTTAWKLLISLLPNQHQTSSGSHKPSWRNLIPDDWEKGVTQGEYWEQVSIYAELAVSMASHDMGKLNELIIHLDHLPEPSFNKALEIISSEEITSKSEDERLEIWNSLVKFVSKHKRYSEAEWALKGDIISKIENVTVLLAPKNPLNLHRRIFNGHNYELYEENGDWEQQQIILDEKRQDAVIDIFAYGGIESVIKFCESVNLPQIVGNALTKIADDAIDNFVIPGMLESTNQKLKSFAGGYVLSRHHSQGWDWSQNIDKSNWSVSDICGLLVALPFTCKTWIKATEWLGENEKVYWQRTYVNPYQANCDLTTAIDKLICNNRPRAAIDCIFKVIHDKLPLETGQIVKALLAAVSTAEPSYTLDEFHIEDIIKSLQEDPTTDPDDLFRVEWAYLPLLDRRNGVTPKHLEYRLASDPGFFCEVIRLLYRSKNEDTTAKEPTERDEKIATNAWKLLQDWQTPPGMQLTEIFSIDLFSAWLEQVKAMCTETGHIDVALSHIGQVLFSSPPDPDGLWIHRSAAEALNAKDAEKMRSGYRVKVYNSRGVHCVDPTGKPERQLAEIYQQKADEIENAGYQRFAVTLRGLAESYNREADRVIAEHTIDS